MSPTDRERVSVVSIKTAAHKLGVCRRTIERLIKAEKIKSIKLSARRRGIPVNEIERCATHGIAS